MVSLQISAGSRSAFMSPTAAQSIIVDPKTPAIGLVHSGRKGTELGVATNAITQMVESFGSEPAELIVQLSPCIRPPHYEIDFAAEIIRQCRALGVKEIHDSGVCTACESAVIIPIALKKEKPVACWRCSR